jgi:hypothetical protein
MARHRRATTKSLERRCARCPGDPPRRPIECPLLTALNSPTRPGAAITAAQKRTSNESAVAGAEQVTEVTYPNFDNLCCESVRPTTAAHESFAQRKALSSACIPGRTRAADTVEAFGWLIFIEAIILMLSPSFAAPLPQLPALVPQSADYLRLVA